jgi:hypothetical protein
MEEWKNGRNTIAYCDAVTITVVENFIVYLSVEPLKVVSLG